MPLANAPNGLAGRLRRLAPAFREIGVEVDFYTQGGASTRFISIKQRH